VGKKYVKKNFKLIADRRQRREQQGPLVASDGDERVASDSFWSTMELLEPRVPNASMLHASAAFDDTAFRVISSRRASQVIEYRRAGMVETARELMDSSLVELLNLHAFYLRPDEYRTTLAERLQRTRQLPSGDTEARPNRS
jgi:hypothetical protein